MGVVITYTFPDGSHVVITNVDPARVEEDFVPADEYVDKQVKGLPEPQPESEDEASVGPEDDAAVANPTDTESYEGEDSVTVEPPASDWPDDVASQEEQPGDGGDTAATEQVAPPLAGVEKKLGAFAQRKDIPGPVRAGMGAIRAMWMTFFSAFGFVITWLVDNYSALHMPMWIGLIVGSVAYGIKRFLFPDTTF